MDWQWLIALIVPVVIGAYWRIESRNRDDHRELHRKIDKLKDWLVRHLLNSDKEGK